MAKKKKKGNSCGKMIGKCNQGRGNRDIEFIWEKLRMFVD